MANFMDFNVQISEKQHLAKTLAMAAKLGYSVAAVNHCAPSIDSIVKKKKKDKDYHAIPLPETLKVDAETLKNIMAGTKKFRQLSRFSTIMEDVAQLQKLNTPEIQAFDLVAVQPLTEKIFHVAVSSLKIDIITVDVTQKLPYPIKRPLINVALERGIYFEIQYSPAIRDSTSRKYMIANAQTLIRVCKGKNVIISSGCLKAMDLRGPHDVANLGLLFGMSQEQAKAAITTNCQSLLLHSESRKITKSTVGVVHKTKLEEKDKWIIEQNSANSKNKSESRLTDSESRKTDNDNSKSVKRVLDGRQSDDIIEVKKFKLDVKCMEANDIKSDVIK
ncbi:ribonuclease P/MRP protein subunit RPP1 [Mytilus galloprovincialis]|uniref:Ribonuclease P/MRP protein subunit RPP1 n=2 Tax=Mytilus galloprovincialis TaxID=29158 RepID=A0A8B6E0V0_MYTGA|nr:ribonuclease P/MRP protein subunit RPP1 [Mytilus galloprovincialis]